MIECKCFGMKRLPGKYFKAVPYKLLVLCESCPFEYLVAAIFAVIEKGMPDITEVDPDLMCTACLQLAFNQ
jgi:hypothetical protein